ncbi:MAG: methyltransferase domain-containing protein [Planctomycetia bacterium]|nr:methyltransferase domain-containing protein [Planctomycetia bacterium]
MTNRLTLQSRYPLRKHELTAGTHHLEIVAPADPDSLLDDPTVEARYKKDQYLPYWPVIWPSSLMLAEHILDGEDSPPLWLANNSTAPPRAIELGCGLGIAGIAAAKRGWHVTFTDYDEEAIAFAAYNASCNNIPAHLVEARPMDWRWPMQAQFEWIIASDVLYERRLHPILLAAMDRLMAPTGMCWISDPRRNSAADFPPTAVEHGFHVATSVLKWTGPAGVNSDADLLILRRARRPAVVSGVAYW